jgi:glycosyltransferase involved in cell wall biosynthesis
MAAGVPTIASAVGTNFRIVDNGVNGFLVKSENEWIDSIKRLLSDKDLREKFAINGRKTIEDRFSLEANKDKYITIIEETAQS